LEFSKFDFPAIFFWGGGAPKILKPVLDTPFQGLLLETVWTMPADLRSQRWEVWGLPNFKKSHHKFWTIFLKLQLYPTFSAIKVAYRSSNLEDLRAKEKKRKKETSVVKRNTTAYTTSGRRYNKKAH